jgi:hypothetical protein
MEGAVKAALDTMLDPFNGSNGATLVAALDCLNNLMCSDFNLRILLASDGVRTILAALQDHDWDQDVVSTAVNLLHQLMESNDTVPGRIFNLHGHRTLLCVMAAHPRRPDVLTSICHMFTDIVHDASIAGELYSEAVPSILASIETLYLSSDFEFDESGMEYATDGDGGGGTGGRTDSLHEDDNDGEDYEGGRGSLVGMSEGKQQMVTGFLQSALQCLVSFCKSDAANRCIAEDGMHILVDCMTHYFEVPEILKCIFSLLGYLTFVEDNLRAIVQYNGIEAILLAISTNPENAEMIIKAVRTLSNLAIANEEHRRLVVECGGKDVIEVIAETYNDHSAVEDMCQNALFTLMMGEHAANTVEEAEKKEAEMAGYQSSGGGVRGPLGGLRALAADTIAMSPGGGSGNRGGGFGGAGGHGRGGSGGDAGHRDGMKVTDHQTVFEQFRNKLLGGALMTKHVNSGTARVRHIYLKPDLRFLAWREPRGKNDKGKFDMSTSLA